MSWFWLLVIVLGILVRVSILGFVFVAAFERACTRLCIVGFEVLQTSPSQVVYEFMFALLAFNAANTISGLTDLGPIACFPLEVTDNALSTKRGNSAESAVAFWAQYRA